MNKKMFKIYASALLLLLIVIISAIFWRSNMNSLSRFSSLIESELEEISLTIYYMDFIIQSRPLQLHELTGGWYDDTGRLRGGMYNYRVVVTGEELANHRELLVQLANVELVPTRGERRENSRLYYVFEHTRHGEIFSYLAFNLYDGSVFVNGRKVEDNRIFYDVLIPFLPESIAEEFQRTVDAYFN